MKEIDSIGIKLCEYQSDLFEKSTTFFNCGSAYFIKIFMYSNLSKRIDSSSFLLESLDVNAALAELKTNNSFNRGSIIYPSYVMKWIGYIYRYFSFTCDFSSKKVFTIIKPKELYGLYEAYHSLDPKETIERIMESKKIKNINFVELAKKYYL